MGFRTYSAVALVATLLLSSVAGVGVAAPAAGGTGATTDGATLGTDTSAAKTGENVTRGDWRPHYRIDVHRNGTATVTTTLEGPGAPGTLRLSTGRGELLAIRRGSDGIERFDRYLRWNTTAAETVSFHVELGVQDRPVNTGTFDDAVLFALSEVVPVWRAGPFGSLPAAHRFTVEAPANWSVAAPGRQVGPNTYEVVPAVDPDTFPREMILVGEFEVETRSVGESEVRVATVPSAEGPASTAEVADFLARVTPTLTEIYGTELRYGRMVAVTPRGFENGGLARHHSLIVSADTPLYEVRTSRSGYVHELAHTFQRFRGPRWHKEGQASYVQTYALYEAGITTESEYRRMLQTWITTPRNEVGEPVRATAAAEPYFKGAAVYAALDADIRARTNGTRDIGDFIAATYDQSDTGDRDSYKRRFKILRSEQLAVLERLTGRNYTAFYDRYVDGTEMPDELLADDFSLSTPPTIESESTSEQVLRTRLEERERRIESLRQRLNATRAENRELRQRLNATQAENADLRQRLNATRAANRELREQLNATRAENANLREQLNETRAENRELRERVEQLEANASNGGGTSEDAVSGGAGHGFGAVPAVAALVALAVASLARRW